MHFCLACKTVPENCHICVNKGLTFLRTKSPKPENLQQMELKKLLPTVKDDIERTQESDEDNNDVDT